MGVAFTTGQEMAVYVGDLVHHPLQIEHPEWCPTFDALPPISRETRRKLIAALRNLENKRDSMPARKHGNIPL